jgi:peptide deformylase
MVPRRSMAGLEIRLLGDPVLRERAAEVETVDADVRRLAQEMFTAMYEAEGVGLAAPQVGIARRIIVVDPHEEGIAPMAIVNPRIAAASPITDKAEEGCLSIPGVREVVTRAAAVTVEGLGLHGQRITVDAEGLHARVLQHEIDHLDGVLFLDRLSPLKRRLALKRWEKVKPVSDHVPPTATRGGL